MSGVMVLQQHVLNLLYSVLKFKKESRATLKVLIKKNLKKEIKNVVSLKNFMVSKFSGSR